MPITTRIQSIDKDINLLLSDAISPEGRSLALAEFAGEQIDEAKEINRSVLGRVPPYTTFVDGRADAPLRSVRPDGVIVTQFELVDEALTWIGEQLELHSPVKTGRYKRSHMLFADGRQTEFGGVVPASEEYVFINSVPYARKIERGSSSQAPDGVYQVVAILAQGRFGNIARISFSYRTAIGGEIISGRQGHRSDQRNPAVIVRLRG